jgi:hypothetical protein
MAKGGTASGALAFDNSTRANNGEVNVVYVKLADAYKAPITSGTLIASVSAGTVNVVEPITYEQFIQMLAQYN